MYHILTLVVNWSVYTTDGDTSLILGQLLEVVCHIAGDVVQSSDFVQLHKLMCRVNE